MTEALRRARAEQETADWQKDYALRAGVEGAIRQATAVTGLRRTRLPEAWRRPTSNHVYSAVALNLIRLDAWWNGHPLDRTTHFARLGLSLMA